MSKYNPMEKQDQYLKSHYRTDKIPVDELEKYLMEAAVMNLISTRDTHISKEMTYEELHKYMEEKIAEKNMPKKNSIFQSGNIFSGVKNAAENFFYAEEDTQIEEDFNAFKSKELKKISPDDNELVKKIVFSYLNYEEKKINKYEDLIKRSIANSKKKNKKSPLFIIVLFLCILLLIYVYLELSCTPY